MRKAIVKVDSEMAGWLTEDENGFCFQYNPEYLCQTNPQPVSLTLPLSNNIYRSQV